MKKVMILTAILGVVPLCGMGTCNPTPPDSELRAGITQEELEAAPGYHQMKGALLSDVRVWRELHKHLDEGAKACAGLDYDDAGNPICVTDLKPFEVYALKIDAPDQVHRVEESAYYCREEGIYYYHYVGGPRRQNLWLGPYKIDRKRVKPE